MRPGTMPARHGDGSGGEQEEMPVSGMPRRLRRATVFLAVALLAQLRSVLHRPIRQDRRSPMKPADAELWFTMVMAVVVFVAVKVAHLHLMRYRKTTTICRATHGSTIIEIIWTTIPVVIVIALFSYSFVVLRDVENKADPEDMTIEVQGFQYQWAFKYNLNDLGTNTPDRNAEGDITITGTAAEMPVLRVPIDEPVEFALASADVIHSFYVKDFLYKLDVIPGRDNRFVVIPREVGSYYAQCAESALWTTLDASHSSVNVPFYAWYRATQPRQIRAGRAIAPARFE